MLKKRILVLMFLLVLLPLVGCLTPSNQAPILTSSPITTATVGVEYTYDVNATDPDGDTLTYSLATPGGMTINSATGLIKWTPVTAQVGDNSVTVKVSDGSLSITQSFTIKVSTLPPVVNQAPVIHSTPATTATVGVKYTYTITATDPEGDPIIYSLFSGPTGMGFDGIATISWTPVLGQVGANGVIMKASDGKLSTPQSFTITVSELPPVNQAPVITPIPNLAAIVGVAFTYDVNATDPDGNTLTYSLTTYPSNMTINSATGVISWIPTLAQVGNNPVTVKAFDGTLGDAQSFTVTVVADITAPTAVTLTPVGGNVVANTVNGTNTNLTFAATIIAGEATGGKAEFYVGATKIGTDIAVLVADTTVTFIPAYTTTTELQAGITAGGVVTCKLYDAVGNVVTSMVNNPTLIVDYVAPTATLPAITGLDNNTTTIIATFSEDLYYGGIALVDTANVKASFTPDPIITLAITTAIYNVVAKTITFTVTGALDTNTIQHNTDFTKLTDAAGNAYPNKTYLYTAVGTLWTTD